jgi:hypothetical protein
MKKVETLVLDLSKGVGKLAVWARIGEMMLEKRLDKMNRDLKKISLGHREKEGSSVEDDVWYIEFIFGQAEIIGLKKEDYPTRIKRKFLGAYRTLIEYEKKYGKKYHPCLDIIFGILGGIKNDGE